MKRLLFALLLLGALCFESCRAGDCGCPMSDANIQYPVSDDQLPRFT